MLFYLVSSDIKRRFFKDPVHIIIRLDQINSDYIQSDQIKVNPIIPGQAKSIQIRPD